MSQYEALAAEENIKAVPEKVRNKTSDEADAAVCKAHAWKVLSGSANDKWRLQVARQKWL